MNRRGFLKALVGGAAALPLVTSRLARRAFAASGAVPKRFLVYYFNGGVVMDSTIGGTVSTTRDGWRPVSGVPANPTAQTAVTLTKAMLTPSLLPIYPHLANALFVDNVGMTCATNDPNRGKMNGHEPSALSGLTASYTKYNTAITYPDGGSISLDQYLASKIGGGTALASLNMQTGGSLYHSSFSAAMTRVANVQDPLAMYTGDGFATIPSNAAAIAAAQAQAHKLTAQRALVLGALDTRYQNLEAKVAAGDQATLEQSRAALAQIGTRPIGVVGGGACTAPPKPASYYKYGAIQNHANEPLVLADQIQLAATAFACDLTRVINLAYYTNYYSLYVPGVTATDYHGTIEHGNPSDPARNAQMNAVLKWHMTNLATLVSALKAIPEGSGTVFDNTTILVMNEFGEKTHTVEDPQPFMILGGANCGFKTGRYVSYPLVGPAKTPQPHNNLYVSLLNSFGQNVSTFGSPECTGALAGLTA